MEFVTTRARCVRQLREFAPYGFSGEKRCAPHEIWEKVKGRCGDYPANPAKLPATREFSDKGNQ